MDDIFFKFIMFFDTFFYLKIIFIILSLAFLLIIAILFLKTSWLEHRFLESFVEFFVYRPFGAKKAFKNWEKIYKRLEVGQEADYKLALIEADNLLNDILAKIGFTGETIGERLKKLDREMLPNIEEVLEAHKIRNNVVHDPDYQLSLDQAKKTLGVYEEALRRLEAF